MRFIDFNHSSAYADGFAETSKATCPDRVPDGFSLGLSKMSYLISDASGLYFKVKKAN